MAVKLERLNEYVLIVTVMVVGTLLAIFSGRLSGAGNSSMLIKIVAVVGSAIICLAMRSKVWLLIPLTWSLSAQLNSVPGRLPARDLVVTLVLICFFMLKAFKIVRSKARYGWLDLLMVVNLLYLLTAFLRNPVGVNVFGSEMIGGRPYLEVIFALGGYWVMNQVIVTPKQAWTLPFLFVAVSAFLAMLNTLTYYFPFLTPVLGKFYGGVSADAYKRELAGRGEEGEGRMTFLAGFGSTIINILSAYFSPLTMINPLYIMRFTLTLLAVYFCLKSGHRMTIPSTIFIVLMATYFRKGLASVIIMCMIAIPPFVILVAMQGHGVNLPESAQRTLSFLPGKWDPVVISEAQGSTDWRLEMWKIVMSESKYIKNKTFGDGFGFTREDMEEMSANGSQEDFMRVGDYHSGPISTIHIVGYFGLFLFLLLLAGVAVRSTQLILRSKGTPFFPIALLLGIPSIYQFFGFILVFGDYGKDLPNIVMAIGFLNLISNGMIAARQKAEQPDPQLPDKPSGLDSMNHPGPVPVMLR